METAGAVPRAAGDRASLKAPFFHAGVLAVGARARRATASTDRAEERYTRRYSQGWTSRQRTHGTCTQKTPAGFGDRGHLTSLEFGQKMIVLFLQHQRSLPLPGALTTCVDQPELGLAGRLGRRRQGRQIVGSPRLAGRRVNSMRSEGGQS